MLAKTNLAPRGNIARGLATIDASASVPPAEPPTMSNLDHFDTYHFESVAAQNGTLAWREEALMEALGYPERKSFRKAVRRAMQACLTLNIEPSFDFIPVGDSYKFTRFACYLIAMNGDPRKPKVAAAQVYFASLADSIHSHHEQAGIVDRVVIREEMTEGIKSLSKTAHEHGVYNYASFMNAGYRGMYNMSLPELSHVKGVGPKEKLIDRMDRAELAANLFRLTQTDTKIKNDDIQGQRALEKTALEVGQVVRNTMIQISGTRPEDIPIVQHIKDAKKVLKTAGKKMEALSEPIAARQLFLRAVAEEYPENIDEEQKYTADPEEDVDDFEEDD